MLSADAQIKIDRQRLQLLFDQARTTSLVALLGALLVTWIFHTAFPVARPFSWLGAVVLTTSLRFALYRRFSRVGKEFDLAYWLRLHGISAVFVGLAWGSVPLLPNSPTSGYLHELHVLIPGFILMATITSYGIFFSQYCIFLTTVSATTIVTRVLTEGPSATPEILLFALFLPALLVTARRYGNSMRTSFEARLTMQQLVEEMRSTNETLQQRNHEMAMQKDIMEQEEALAKHVFSQLVLAGRATLPGIHVWQESLGTLSGDLVQSTTSQTGEIYLFVGDFTGHGLPAALGALPAASVFQAMATKGLPLDAVVAELNRKLYRLLPSSHFCCALLIRMSADRTVADVWNGGLPPLLVAQRGRSGLQEFNSHALPLGIVDETTFDASTYRLHLDADSVLYAYTDGLIEAGNANGEMWGSEPLRTLLGSADLEVPRLHTLQTVISQFVASTPRTDDISFVEIEARECVLADAENVDWTLVHGADTTPCNLSVNAKMNDPEVAASYARVG